MAIFPPGIKITAGPYDFTNQAENITFSSADPGGYEMASFDLETPQANVLLPGMPVRLYDGLQCIWHGRISEPGKNIKHGWGQTRRVGSATTRVSCEGSGAILKDNAFSMIYIDRDLTRWQEWSIDREYLFGVTQGHNVSQFSWQIGAASTTTGEPGFIISGTGVLLAVSPIIEIWYDAGPQNIIGVIRLGHLANQNLSPTDPNNFIGVFVAPDLVASSSQLVQIPANSTNYTFYPTIACRYGAFQLSYELGAGSAGGSGVTYGWELSGVFVLGNHGLGLISTSGNPDTYGYYVSQIAADAAYRAMQASARMHIGQIDTLSNYVLQHYVQYTAVTHDQVMQDMAQLGPAHYGVWESSSSFDDTPEFLFVAYHQTPDFYTSLADCNEVDVSIRLANLYTTATVTFQDAAGTEYEVSVSLPDALLSQVGIQRTTVLDLGTSSTAAAETFASFALQTLYAQARSAGSVTLPKRVRDAAGALMPSYRLKAGLHRLRINDLPSTLSEITSFDNDSFRISRQESNIDTTSGEITTRVELDAGPNLIETLQARLNVAQTVAGLG